MRPSRIEWTKPDEYHATWNDWTIARCIVEDADRFVVWIGRMSGRRMPNRVPCVFAAAADAVAWVRWVEDNAREYQRDQADVELTKEQRELI